VARLPGPHPAADRVDVEPAAGAGVLLADPLRRWRLSRPFFFFFFLFFSLSTTAPRQPTRQPCPLLPSISSAAASSRAASAPPRSPRSFRCTPRTTIRAG